MHHLEFEESGLKESDMERMVKDRRILYDHSVKQEEEKYRGKQLLEKVNVSYLPEYIKNNLDKYKDWLD